MASAENNEVDLAPAPRPGVFGRFYLQELINSGGMAEIWIATDSSGKTFALRRLHQRLRFNFTARKRFSNGCEILATIPDHDGIIGYHEHGKIDGKHYLLMEYVEGEKITAYCDQRTLGLKPCLQLFLQVLRAVQYAHSRGILHRDLKPGNILLDGRGEPLVSDFGLAKWLDTTSDLTRTLTIFGTPGYIAPIAVMTAGYALFQTANNTAVMTDIRPDQRGVISGMLNLSRNLGLITGASVMGALFALASGSIE